MFLVNFLASKEEVNELLKVFQHLDKDGDGKLSKEELITGFSLIFQADKAKEEVEKLMKHVDKNNNQYVDYTEWVMATINRENLLSKARLETAFKMFDKDNSGTLEKNEIKEIFSGMGDIFTENVWDDMI